MLVTLQMRAFALEPAIIMVTQHSVASHMMEAKVKVQI